MSKRCKNIASIFKNAIKEDSGRDRKKEERGKKDKRNRERKRERKKNVESEYLVKFLCSFSHPSQKTLCFQKSFVFKQCFESCEKE